jgi:hypothetical protein
MFYKQLINTHQLKLLAGSKIIKELHLLSTYPQCILQLLNKDIYLYVMLKRRKNAFCYKC